MQQIDSSSRNSLATVLALMAATLIGAQVPFAENASGPGSAEPTATMHLTQAAHASQPRIQEATSAPTLVHIDTQRATRHIESGSRDAAIAIEDHFWEETYDGSWTADMESKLLDALEQRSVSDTTLDIVQCHNSICLVEFFHNTEQARKALLHHLGAIRTRFGGFLVKTDDNGLDIRTLVYFARPKQPLPLPFNLPASV